MKKNIKKLFLILILLVIFSIPPTNGVLADNGLPTQYTAIRELAETNTKVINLMKNTARVYKLATDNSKVYDMLLKGAFSPDKENASNNDDDIVSIDPKWYNYIPISGSLDHNELTSYGPYNSCDWMYITLNWTPSDVPVTIIIYDQTAHKSVASKSSANGEISLSKSLNIAHSYEVFIYNNSSKGSISYYGRITLSEK